MPFVPHTDDDVQAMLATIGADCIEDLFDEIPSELRIEALDGLPGALSEMEIGRLMHERAAQDGAPLNFIGAGAYEHHIPAAVWQLATRGEFYTAYTPYQAEASQGTLQVIYEYQSMLANLTGMEVSNASMYDGATALAEAVLMAVRANRKSRSRRVLMPRTVHPAYRAAVRAIVGTQGIEAVELDYDAASGRLSTDTLAAFEGEDFAALVIPQPNFFGMLEEVDDLTRWTRAQGMLAIAVVNPMTLAVLSAPGGWGESGVDIVCGEGQPLGIPLSSGGPYFGFLCTQKPFVHKMPGRIVGQTIDADGQTGFVLTLQAREQHIRRSRATSNICTNQGLMVTAATIFMALLGSEGLARVAAACYANTHALGTRLTAIDGVQAVFDGAYFQEAVLRVNPPVDWLLNELAEHNILGGYRLGNDYPALEDCLLVCATETKTEQDLTEFVEAMQNAMPASAPSR